MDASASPTSDGSSPALPAQVQAPDAGCATCTQAPSPNPAKDKKKVTHSKQTVAQVGPVILGYGLADDGTSHLIVGGGTPGLGVGAYQCTTTGEGGIDGWAGGVTGGAPVAMGVGPAASYATDGVNTTSCVGVGAGDVNGAAYTVTTPLSSPFGPSGNPGDQYVPASMNPDGSIAPARMIPAAPAPVTTPAAIAPPAPVPANANFSYGSPGDTYVPAAMNPDGSITQGYSIPRGK